MKAAVACVSALVLPLPAHTFVATPAAPTRSRTIGHIVTRAHASPRRSLRPPHMTAHAVNLCTTVGAGGDVPAATLKQETPALPALDRSSLGLHLKIGAKVINL